MERKKRIWIIAVIIIIVILLLLFWYSKTRKNNNNNNANINHNSQSDNNLHSYLEEQDAIMLKMMNDMENVPKSGNASVHFLKGMTPHHESAIEMAESCSY